jgi:beta-glucanase (GH16 family)
MMKKIFNIALMSTVLFYGCTNDSAPTRTKQSDDGWKLVWFDEFDSTSLDLHKWMYETGGGGWGNNEKEYYRKENISVAGGNLVIEARNEEYSGYHYTSGRMITAGLASWTYGKIIARMKLPYGKGLWPAFWMMGNSGEWPARGEIDIMEMVGGPGALIHGSGSDSKVYGSMHWANDIGFHVGVTGTYEILKTVKFADDFHDFSAEWDSTQVQFFVDGTKFFDCPINDPGLAAFHHPFFILLNLAVGGNFPGDPDTTTVFPQRLTVDWVRVYQR